jgi:hypothetical protein
MDGKHLTADPLGSMLTDEDDESMESDIYGDELAIDELEDGELDLDKYKERQHMQDQLENETTSSMVAN